MPQKPFEEKRTFLFLDNEIYSQEDENVYKPIKVVQGKHSKTDTLLNVWFKDLDGNIWWGTCYGASAELRCRRLTGENEIGRRR